MTSKISDETARDLLACQTMGLDDTAREIIIDYTNWRGERGLHKIRPTGRCLFEQNQWHPTPQWLLEAVNVDKNETRLYAIATIHCWYLPS
jgi:hypothetical protein